MYFKRPIQIWAFMRLQIILMFSLIDEIIEHQDFKQAVVIDNVLKL